MLVEWLLLLSYGDRTEQPHTCLEGHVLQEVGGAVVLLILIAASSIDPQPDLKEIQADEVTPCIWSRLSSQERALFPQRT